MFVAEHPFRLTRLGVRATDQYFDSGADVFRQPVHGRGTCPQLLVRIVGKPLEQPALEVGVGGFGGGMLGIPHGQLLTREWFEVPFDHGRWVSEFEMLIQESVKCRTCDGVVIVRKVLAAESMTLSFAPYRAYSFVAREAFGRKFPCPVIRVVHALRLGGEKCREFDVSSVDAQQRGILTGTATLHRRADHDTGERKLDAIIDGRQQTWFCVPPPLAPVIAIRSGSTSGNLSTKFEPRPAFSVCRPMMLCRFASACGLYRPQFSVVFISGRCLANLHNFRRQLGRIGVAQHVPLPNDATHPGELYTHRLEHVLRPPAQIVLLRWRSPSAHSRRFPPTTAHFSSARANITPAPSLL